MDLWNLEGSEPKKFRHPVLGYYEVLNYYGGAGRRP